MRQDCKHYQRRTYPSGETVRKCNLDLAPEAPWRCPENCPAFKPRMADVGWSYGTLQSDLGPPKPEGYDESAAPFADILQLLGDFFPEIPG